MRAPSSNYTLLNSNLFLLHKFLFYFQIYAIYLLIMSFIYSLFLFIPNRMEYADNGKKWIHFVVRQLQQFLKPRSIL